MQVAKSAVRRQDLPRAKGRFAVSLDNTRSTVLATTLNLSEGGMFLELDEPLSVGTVVRFELSLASEQLRGLGRVVWNRTKSDPSRQPSGMGLEFVAVRDPGRLRSEIQRLLSRRTVDGSGKLRRGKRTSSLARITGLNKILSFASSRSSSTGEATTTKS